MALNFESKNFSDAGGTVLVQHDGALALKLNHVRLIGASLHELGTNKQYENADPAYHMTVLGNTVHEPAYRALMERFILESKKPEVRERFQGKLPEHVLAFNGNRVKVMKEYPLEALIVHAREKNKAPICVLRGQELNTPLDIKNTFYRGCYVDVVISPYYRSKPTAGFSYNLLAVNFSEDGDPLKDGVNLNKSDVSSLFGVTDAGTETKSGFSFG